MKDRDLYSLKEDFAMLEGFQVFGDFNLLNPDKFL